MKNRGGECPRLKAPRPLVGLGGGQDAPAGHPPSHSPASPALGRGVTPGACPGLFHKHRRRPRPHIPPLGMVTQWGPGPGQGTGSFFLSLGKIYNFCFFLIFIFIYIDIYIYTHLVTQEKEKKNRIRNNNNKKKYSGLKTIHSYHARRAIDCTRPTSGWPSRDGPGHGAAGCGPPCLAGVAASGSPRRAAEEQPRSGVCQPPQVRGGVEKEKSSGGCWPISPWSGSPWSPQSVWPQNVPLGPAGASWGGGEGASSCAPHTEIS